MELSINLTATGRDGQAIARRIVTGAAGALRSGLLVALQIVLGTFVVGYPLLRLGYLGPVPEGHAIEAALGIVAGAMAGVLFVLEGSDK